MATLLSLRTDARAVADQDNSTFPTDPQYNAFINRAASTVWRRMVAAGWRPKRTVFNITLTGAAQYSIDSPGFVEIVDSVHWLGTPGSTNFRVPLRRVKPEEIDTLLVSQTGNNPIAYDLLGGGIDGVKIEFYPNPPSGLVEIRYTNGYGTGLVVDSDTWFGPAGSDELIILTAAIEGMSKEDADTEKVERRLKERWSEVLEGASFMDATGQQTVRDARKRSLFPFDFNARDGYDFDSF